MAYGIFNPLEDTNTYPFMNGRNPGVYGNSYKTFAQLLEDINAKGFNTAIVRPSKSGDGNLAYYTIIGFNIPDSDIFRIGNDEYFTGSYYPNGIYFENFGDVSVPNVGGYYYANGSLVDTGVSYTLYTRCSATQSKDNVSYHGVSGDDNNCLDLGCVIVSNANVGTWYFNNQPLNPPTNESGGAGSGYIGNSLVSNKKMVGYNVPTSSAESTKTESIDEASESPVSGKPKIGNGHARIKFLRELNTEYFFTDSFNPDLMKDEWNLSTCKSGFGGSTTAWAPTIFSSSDFLSTYNFLVGNSNRSILAVDNGNLRRPNYNFGASDCVYWIPINRVNGELKSLEWDYCNLNSRGGSYEAIGILIGWVDSNNGWHQSTIAWIDRLWSSEWQHAEYTNLSPGNPYIDYIGIYTCDGQPACKNIKFIVG